TELRFYVAASMAWLTIGGLVLAVLVLRDRMRWLVHGLAFAAVAVTLAVTAIGPQAFITDQNVARVLDPALVPAAGYAGLDTEYLAQFGDDAIPALVRAWPRVDAATRAELQPVLIARWHRLRDDPATSSWVSWNLSRERARSALASLFRP
ncbi:MAG TPA: DUF4153 domain-containing protein, partial [Candidatus Limnocylindrales bacterium]